MLRLQGIPGHKTCYFRSPAAASQLSRRRLHFRGKSQPRIKCGCHCGFSPLATATRRQWAWRRLPGEVARRVVVSAAAEEYNNDDDDYDYLSDDDVELYHTLDAEFDEAALKEALGNWGMEPTGVREDDLLMLLPIERATRVIHAAPAASASAAPAEDSAWEAEQPVGILDPPAESGFEAMDKVLYKPEDELQSKDPFFDPQAASRSAGKASSSRPESTPVTPSTEPQTDGHWKVMAAQLKRKTKAETLEELEALGVRRDKLQGTKPEVVDLLVSIRRQADEEGVQPEEVVWRQNELQDALAPPEEPAPAPAPQLPAATEFDGMTLHQLRAALRAQGVNPKGNKGDMIAKLQQLQVEAAGPPQVDLSQPLPPWEEDARNQPSEQEVQQQLDALPEKETNGSARLPTEEELLQLTVREITNMIKDRGAPVGQNKRKVDLVQRLLDVVRAEKEESVTTKEYPPRSAPNAASQPPTHRQSQENNLETLEAVQGYLPGWRPPRPHDSVAGWPIVEIRRELLERGLSTSGSRAKIVARMTDVREHEEDVRERLDQLEDSACAELLRILNPRAKTLSRQVLSKELLTRDWYGDQQVEAGQGGVVPAQVPPSALPGDPAITVAVLCSAGQGFSEALSLQSARTLLQQLQRVGSTREAGTGSVEASAEAGGIRVDVYMVDGQQRAWAVSSRELLAACPANLHVVLQERGEQLPSKEALLERLKESAQVVFPVVGEQHRGLLADLEAAGISFVGTSFEAGELAANKGRCRERLSELGYPVLAQLQLQRADFLDGSGSAASSRLAEWASSSSLDAEIAPLVVKPARSSAAIGVELVNGLDEAAEAAQGLMEQGWEEVVVEPLVRGGVEFSVLVVDTPAGPQAMLPLEVELYNMDEAIIDADLEVQRFFTKLQGWDDEDVDPNIRQLREELVTSSPDLVLFDTAKKHGATGKVRLHAPPRLPLELSMAIRDAAAKLFKDLGLRDFARLDGFVQLPPEPVQPRTKPAELDEFVNPKIDDVAAAVPPMSNYARGLVPPWEPQEEEPEEDEDAWMQPLLEDGGFENMGPYSDEAATAHYHSKPFIEGLPFTRRIVEGGETNPKPRPEILPREDGDEGWEAAEVEGVFDDEDWDEESEQEFEEEGTLYADDWGEEPAIVASSSEEAEERPLTEEEQEEKMLAEAALADEEPLDLDAFAPEQLCRWDTGTILFTDVNVSPSLEPTSLAFQAAAESGLSQEGLLRHLISAASTRQGSPGLQWLPAESIEDSMLATRPPAMPELSWEDYPAVTDWERSLPWFHDQFKLSFFAEDEEEDLDLELEGPLARELAAEGSRDGGAADAEERPAQRQRVWVLCGGESSERNLSVASGLNVYLHLRQQPDLQVELFLLSPPFGGLKERERVKLMLEKRTDRIKITSDLDTPQPEELQLQNVRNPQRPEVELPMREVWAIPYNLALRASVDEIQEACESTLKSNSTIQRLQEPWQQSQVQLRTLVRDQLLEAGVASVGSIWGEQMDPVAPKCLDMYEFAVRAGVQDAAVFSVLHGGVGENGEVQKLLERLGVPFVGSNSLTTATCHDKGQTADAIAELDLQVIETAPKCHLSTKRLFAETTSEEAVNSLMAQIRDHLGSSDNEPVCIKPANEGGGVGVARLDTAMDLAVYTEQLRERQEIVEELTLSWGNPPILLPTQRPSHFLVEPFLQADSLVVRPHKDGSGSLEVAWTNTSRWVEVSIGLLGAQGKMRALTPMLLARTPTQTLEVEFQEPAGEAELADGPGGSPAAQAGGGGEVPSWDGSDAQAASAENGLPSASSAAEAAAEVRTATFERVGEPVPLCPPPASLVSAEVLASVQERAEIVAHRLGLAGYACLEGVMNADTGSLMVTEVDTLPVLHPESPFLAQALAEDPPMMPGNVLRQILRIGLLNPPDGSEVMDNEDSEPQHLLPQSPMNQQQYRGGGPVEEEEEPWDNGDDDDLDEDGFEDVQIPQRASR